MAELDMRDPRLHQGDPAKDQHGPDDAYAYHRGSAPPTDDSPFISDHHAPRASDRGSTELRGASSDQERIDQYRRANDAPNQLNNLGHPQDRGTTRADAYGKTTDAHASYRRR